MRIAVIRLLVRQTNCFDDIAFRNFFRADWHFPGNGLLNWVNVFHFFPDVYWVRSLVLEQTPNITFWRRNSQMAVRTIDFSGIFATKIILTKHVFIYPRKTVSCHRYWFRCVRGRSWGVIDEKFLRPNISAWFSDSDKIFTLVETDSEERIKPLGSRGLVSAPSKLCIRVFLSRLERPCPRFVFSCYLRARSIRFIRETG